MGKLHGKDKYLSIIIVLFLILIARGSGDKGVFSIIFSVFIYIMLGKIIIKLATIVQKMIHDVKNMFKV